jgi:two-component system LytT family response regulator
MMNSITALVVDDEKDSRESLQNYLRKYCPEVKVQQACANIQEAAEAIKAHQPQLVFLDIEMPYGNAFDLLDQLEEVDFEIVFVTAYSQYAIPALNLSAAYYLLKPIDIDELIAAVAKVRDELQQQDRLARATVLREHLQGNAKRLVLPLIDGFEVVETADILYCEAADNFTCFYMQSGEKHLICRKLKFYEELLSPRGFCRIHRSTLANLSYVQRYLKGKGGTVVLKNGKELAVSQSRKEAFLEQMYNGG